MTPAWRWRRPLALTEPAETSPEDARRAAVAQAHGRPVAPDAAGALWPQLAAQGWRIEEVRRG